MDKKLSLKKVLQSLQLADNSAVTDAQHHATAATSKLGDAREHSAVVPASQDEHQHNYDTVTKGNQIERHSELTAHEKGSAQEEIIVAMADRPKYESEMEDKKSAQEEDKIESIDFTKRREISVDAHDNKEGDAKVVVFRNAETQQFRIAQAAVNAADNISGRAVASTHFTPDRMQPVLNNTMSAHFMSAAAIASVYAATASGMENKTLVGTIMSASDIMFGAPSIGFETVATAVLPVTGFGSLTPGGGNSFGILNPIVTGSFVPPAPIFVENPFVFVPPVITPPTLPTVAAPIATENVSGGAGSGPPSFVPPPPRPVDITPPVHDPNLGSSTPSTPANTAPVAVAGTKSAVEDGAAVTGTLSATDANSGDTKTFTVVTNGAYGVFAITDSTSGDYSYTIDNSISAVQALGVGATLTDTLTFRVADSSAATDEANVVVTIAGANDAPVAVAGTKAATEDGSAVSGTVSATDVDSSDTKTFTVVTNGVYGSFAITNATTGAYSYTIDNSISAVQALGVGATLTDTLTFRATDSQSATSNANVVVTITGVNDVAVITNLGSDSFSYSEGAGAVIIDQSTAAIVTDVDSSNFDTGTLTVSFTAGSDSAEDILAIRNQGSGAAQIGTSGSNVAYEGTTIGTFTGGSSGSALVITLNSNATATATTALVKNITFQDSDTDNPTTGDRTIRFVLTDGDGGTSANYDVTATVNGVNDVAVITNLGSDSLSYSEGAGAVVVDQSTAAIVSDVDSSNFDTGTLTVSFTAGSDSAEDILAIRNQGSGAGQIGTSGANVTYAGTIIGTFTGGSSGSNLVITLNSSADATATTALVKNITFQDSDTDNPTTGDRTIRFVLTDGDGGTSANYDVTATVNAVNDAPTLSGLASSTTLAENTLNSAAQIVDSDVTFADVDSADLNGGTFTISYSSGGGSEDQLTVAHQGNGAGQIGVSGATVSYAGSAIGTITTNGVNGTNLVIALNTSSATPTSIDALIQAITYQNTSHNPAAARTLSISVTDGDGGTSVAQTITVNVTEEADTQTLTSGTDNFTGTGGTDIFSTSEANFSADDTLAGGAGTDTISFTNAATITTAELANKTGIDVIQLGANSTVALSDAFVDASDNNSVQINNSTYTVSLDVSDLNVARTAVISGTGTATLSVAGKVTSADSVNTTVVGTAGVETFTGGTGADTFTGGAGGDTISGGAGNDVIYADGQAFTSSTISSLLVWFDASNLNANNSNVANGTAVSTWTDAAGAQTNATARNGSATYTVNSIGGRAAVAFDGNDNMEFTRNISDNFTIVSVFKTGAAGAGADNWYSGTGIVDAEVSDGYVDFGLSFSSSGAVMAGLLGDVTVTSTTSGLNNNAGHVAVYQRDATNDLITVTVDNDTPVSSSSGTTSSVTTPSITIGSIQTNFNYLTGDISEILVLNSSITTAERNAVYQYLSYKYGISISGVSLAADTLTGGTGADTFVWSNNSYSSGDASNRDVITDFNTGSGSYNGSEGDLIDISTLVSGPVMLLGATSFSGVANQLIWATSGSDTIVSMDFGGDNTADWSIKLSNFTSSNLTSSNFTLPTNSYALPASGGFILTSGTDTFTGDGSANGFLTLNANFVAADTLTGSTGTDTLVFADGGTITAAQLANKTGIEVIQLNGNSTLTLSDAFVDAADSDNIRINNGSYTLNLDDSAVVAPRTVTIGGTGAVTLTAAGQVTSADGVNTNITGSSGVDTLTGGTGADTLSGGGGGDTITGGAGNDTIYADYQSLSTSLISSLQVWFDASNINGDGTSVVNGAAVSTWVDLAGTATNATATVGSPTYTSSSINGYGAVTFDGNDGLSFTRNIADNFAIIAVFKTATAGSGAGQWYASRGLVDSESGGVVNDFGMSFSSASAVKAGIGNPDTTITSTTSGLNNSAGHIAVFQRDQTNDLISIAVDNNTAATSSAGGTQSLTSQSNIRIGSIDNSYGFFIGDIAEVLIFNSNMTAGELSAVYQYVAQKYGITLSGALLAADTLTGGAGADTFAWGSASYSSGDATNRDVITDFNTGSGSYNGSEGDLIDISTLVSTPIVVLGAASFGGFANQLIWATSGSDTIVSMDFGGDNTADWSIKLSNFTASNLSSSNFTLSANSGFGYTLTSGTDTFVGGTGLDYFTTSTANFAAEDTLTGSTGSDKLIFTDAATVTAASLANKTGIDTIQIAANGNSFTFSDAFVDASDSDNVTITGNYTITTFDTSALNSARHVTVSSTAAVTMVNASTGYAAAGVNTSWVLNSSTTAVYGNSGADTFTSTSANFAQADILQGSTGSDTIAFSNAATVASTGWDNKTGIDVISMSANGNSFTFSDAFVDASDSDNVTITGNYTITTFDTSALNSARHVTVSSTAAVTMVNASTGYAAAGVNTSWILSSSTDTVYGNTGNETFTTTDANFAAADVLQGSTGTDTLAFSDAATVTGAELANKTGIEVVQFAGNSTLTLTDAFVDSTTSDSVQINNGANTLSLDTSALAAARTAYINGTGAVTLTAGGTVYSTTVNTTITGSGSADTIVGNTGVDTISGGDGNDTLTGGYNGDTISGGAGNDVIYADNQTFINSSITGLDLWLDASNLLANNTTTSNGAGITAWNDLSVAGDNDGTTSAGTPVYASSGISGRASITFDGSSGFITGLTSTYGDMFTLAVFKDSTVNEYENIMDKNYNSGWAIARNYINGNTFYLDGSGSYNGTSSGLFTDGAVNLISGGRTSSTYTLFYDGATSPTNSVVRNATAMDDTALHIGEDYGGGYRYAGDIAEILVFDHYLTAAEMLIANQYLSNKYGITMNGISIGADTLTGGTGADTFTWTNASYSSGDASARDVITDFNTGSGSYDGNEGDKIDISTLISAAAFVLGTGSFSGYANQLIWATSGADVIVSMDFGGDNTADWSIKLSTFTASNLTSSNFTLFANSYTPAAGSLIVTNSTDTLTGDENANTFVTNDSNFVAGDTLTGSTGTDTLVIVGGATITAAELANKTGIEIIQLNASGSTLTLSDAFVDAADSDSVRINNSSYTVSLDTSALNVARTAVAGATGTITLTAAGKITSADATNTSVVGSGGADTLAGGTGADTLAGAHGGDTITGGAGNDVIYADRQSFTSSTISNLAFWVDAKNVNGDGTSVASGAAIATWTDLSSGGNNATQATAGNRPTFTYDSQGNAAISFNSSNSHYLINNALASLAGSAHTVVFVGDYTAGTSGDPTVIAWNTSSGSNSEEYKFDNAALTVGQLYHADSNDEFLATDQNYFNAGIVSTVLTVDMVNVTPYMSGYARTVVSDTLKAANLFSIGQEYDSGPNPSDYMNGYLYEIMIFDKVLSAAEITTMNEYLALKYGNTNAGAALGTDTLTGGTGADTFTWSNASYSSGDDSARDVITDFNSSSGSYSASEGDKIDISTLISTAFTIQGLAGANSIVNQLYWSQSTNDTIVSFDENGDNTADWSIKLSSFTAQNLSANDFTWGSTSATTQTGTAGGDTLTGDGKIDIINGGAGNDTINGNGNGDYLNGGADTDTIHGNDGNDVISTSLTGGTDTVYGDAGADVLAFAYSDNNDVTFYGGTGAGGSGNDGIYLRGVGAQDGTWSLSSATGVTSSSPGGGITRLTFNSADASGTITVDDGSTITFQEVDYIDFS